MKREELTDDYTKTVCKMGQGGDCCRYLSLSAKGWDCERWTELAAVIDARVAAETINARGVNCGGVDER